MYVLVEGKKCRKIELAPQHLNEFKTKAILSQLVVGQFQESMGPTSTSFWTRTGLPDDLFSIQKYQFW
jgi:hypothetical protein